MKGRKTEQGDVFALPAETNGPERRRASRPTSAPPPGSSFRTAPAPFVGTLGPVLGRTEPHFRIRANRVI